jgi:dTDP-4-dehydrorhamnose 3,5-epimerase
MGWKIKGLKKDKESITSDWDLVNQKLIDGVKTKEVKNVIKNNGVLTEVWRSSWKLDTEKVDQVFQVTLNPGEITDWHIHEFTTDRIFVNSGLVKIVLYDSREDSPTFGLINEFKIGELRPMIVIIPPKIFHAIQNIFPQKSSLLNIVDKAYTYSDPDHWRLPPNVSSVPYKFKP